MCLLLLANTSGVAYAQHFCGDFEMMATLTFGKEQLSCAMVAVEDDCATLDAESHNCCDNQYTKVITDDNFNTSKDTIKVPLNFVAAFVSVFIVQIENIESANVQSFSEYNPPPLIKNLPVLYESFLI